MVRRKRVALPPGTAKRIGPRSGFLKTIVSLEPEQLAELRAEALRRAQAQGSIRPDVSALVREALKAWLARRR